MKKIIKKIHRRHAIEVITYGLVGGSAWVAQTVVYLVAIRWGIFPSIAMILGNFLGMIVAYMGHVRFTFKRKHKFSRGEFIKFMATSVLGLCFNVGSVRIITKVLLCDPHYAVLPTLLTPLLTFLISKFWAFKD
ncbi:MAG: hypothetical protein QG673_420 [Pseudomonadota bacterium]|nr:hypothetical protein [Pseudomonadota bacterium]